MSWFANRLWLLLLVIGMPAAAEEFTVDVIRGAEVVRLFGNESGEFREEMLHEDPTPRPRPREIEASAPRASDDSGPAIQIIIEAAETTFPAGYVVWPHRAHHRRRPHARPDLHRQSHGGRGVVSRPWSPGHDRSMHKRTMDKRTKHNRSRHNRSVGSKRWSPPR
jgi:hypothetical protein